MDQQYPTVTKIPVLDIGKFEQWQFRIQQYLQHEHYALWEVIEFEDSYVVLVSPLNTTTTDTTSDESGKKSGRTVTLTVEDMQKKKNDVKARTTLLLSLPDEHQLRFKWLMHTIVWRNMGDLDTMSLGDLYNHLKVYESEVQKKLEVNSQNIAFISSAKHSSRNEDVNTACVPTASTNVPTTKCIVLGRDFKLLDDANILLRTPRQHNMYSIDLNNIVPHRDLTCLVAKASPDECILWHRTLGHLNFKTMNKLVRHNLVRALPTKCFKKDHTCTACLKGKQHKAYCKSKLVHSVSKPLHTLHMDLFGPTSKGIKREFRNARTPQQNGITERRNKTLIEAAKTMLADTKLPVTFWAEAVNTACYVQNRVLVNKSHNKTSYELFSGRSLAIGFLKPFGCYVMILNTLDNLGKFEEKGNEGYFIGYSMSSKAFRVFNKRTRRVEENLHVEFLENKAIEKGVVPNWLFDINSLTKSMNYVPVDAGSGNLNPTASTSHSPADQMESLTVETPIPTVSSPVPTTYSTNSQEPSSDARLISKRVANQVETPPLDNILSLTNRFEDILGATTNSDESNGVEADISNMEIAITANESNGVEADISNMETAITASPTLTLRIHKDHPKSQIIGPMDTPIQTRNKSKDVGEQSFIATIYQKTNPALL
nr:hypothetical protein [Tanacetum cinerariifolium]